MTNKINFLDILHNHDKKESTSSADFEHNALLNNVKYKETDTHMQIYNFPGSFGDTQNKNNRVYDQSTLKQATTQFLDIKDSNPYFTYIFDGHRDDDSYENIIGRIVNLHPDESTKCILVDLKLNKGSKSYKTIENIIKDKDPIGISMRIISPDTLVMSKEEISQINESILWLENDNPSLSKLMSNDDEIEYVVGEAFIWRFDLTQFPSFNRSFVGELGKTKNESAISFTKTIDSCGLFAKNDKCITDSCKFKHTIKSFLDIINNSKDESITLINEHPTLYDDMLKFAYMNLSEFNFDEINSEKYLREKLSDFEISSGDKDDQIKTINDICGKNNILSYVTSNNLIDVDKYVKLVNTTLTKLINVDEIFYQMVSTNYLHQLIVSTLILDNKVNVKIKNIDNLKTLLQDTADIEKDTNIDILVKFLNDMDKTEINVYDFTNMIFTYIYGYFVRYTDEIPPITILNESFKRFYKPNTKKLFKHSFAKK